jgi:serine/threonine protein kinase
MFSLEQATKAFEAAWKAGERPLIEAYVGAASPANRGTLLRELIRVELAYRSAATEKPSLDDYKSRFPNHESAIESAFRDMATGISPAGTPPTILRGTEPAVPALADLPSIPGYEILTALTPGGMGVVYRARQIAHDRTVALKMIRTGSYAGPEDRARFRIEAEAIASLSHPHVIEIHECGEWNGMPYLAMEFAEGGSLAQRLMNGPWLSAQAAELVETLARTVQFVHEHGILHRDLKPANVLLQIADCGLRIASEPNDSSAKSAIPNPQSAGVRNASEPNDSCSESTIPNPQSAGVRNASEPKDLSSKSAIRNPQFAIPKIADFGLAKRLDYDQGLTQTQAILGTASYMAPEQAAGNKYAVGPSVDIYGLGAILYEVLTGRPPFQAETRELTIQQVLFDDPQPLTDLRPEVPDELEAICLKCLEKQPERRFPSALALAEELHRYQSGEPISIPAFSVRERDARAARRLGYEILETLAASPRGVQYKARQLALDRIVVLEVVAAGEKLTPSQLERLRARATAVAQLHHPNIVELYDLGELNGRPLIIREYVEGRCLANQPAEPPSPAEETAGLVETIARAVNYAHVQGIVHGALSRAEVLLSDSSACKIIGLGMAAVLRKERTDTDASPTPLHEHAPSTSPASDIYALGGILYEILAGRALDPPGSAEGPSPSQPPRYWRPDVPRELEAICLKCLERDPAGRYPSAAALAEDLRRYRGGEVLFIDDLDAPGPQQRWARRAGYEILELLGQNADGFTYKARQVSRDRIVVLKRIAAANRFVQRAKERFRWEARLLGHLRHPNIAQLYDHGEQSDLVFFAREFVDGRKLVEFAADLYFTAERAWEAAELVESLAHAVQAAHDVSIIHGGLYPGAIHVTPGGVPKITSFRRERFPIRGAEDGLPESEIRRRLCYRAPEQLEDRRRALTRAADVYALGAILYTLLSGQPPCAGDTFDETLANVSEKPPLPPRHWQPAIPEELEIVCLTSLAKLPGARPSSAQTLAEQLGQLLDA